MTHRTAGRRVLRPRWALWSRRLVETDGPSPCHDARGRPGRNRHCVLARDALAASFPTSSTEACLTAAALPPSLTVDQGLGFESAGLVPEPYTQPPPLLLARHDCSATRWQLSAE